MRESPLYAYISRCRLTSALDKYSLCTVTDPWRRISGMPDLFTLRPFTCARSLRACNNMMASRSKLVPGWARQHA
jgi:hypothetical protein